MSVLAQLAQESDQIEFTPDMLIGAACVLVVIVVAFYLVYGKR